MAGTLHITGDDDADRLLNTDADALLVGMLLDQQVPLGWAFRGPSTLRSRLGHLDPARIAAMDVDVVVSACATKPAIHRFPTSMGERIHALCGTLVDVHGGRAERIWADGADAAEVGDRLRDLPGFGEEKAKIFLALLAKTQGVELDGWRSAADPFGDEQPRSAADCHDAASLARVKEWKREQRAAKRDKQGRPLDGAR
ncbi:HhH-GPD-type base excision DNA repair protein [Ilumatobacter sp.]|uniref:HhH-GPD-type base excision DNA repair protein n=1 Tax=Ilumatobacter sp. TaxID=1967498 RepID=UPI003B52E5B0